MGSEMSLLCTQQASQCRLTWPSAWGTAGRAFRLRLSPWTGLFPPCLSPLELWRLAQECSYSTWPGLANLAARCSRLPVTSPGLLLSSPHSSPVIPPNPPGCLQSTLALAQSAGSLLPVHTQRLSDTHCDSDSFRKASWIHTTPDLSSLPPPV